MIADPDTDAVRAQLYDRRTIPGLDQVATAFVGYADSFHPFLKTHHAVLLAADADQFAPLAKGKYGIGAQSRIGVCKSHVLRVPMLLGWRLHWQVSLRRLLCGAIKDGFKFEPPTCL